MTVTARLLGRVRSSRLLSNSSVYLAGTLVNRLFPFFLTPLYTRIMPSHDFGTWGFCMTVLNALLVIADLGIGGATTRLYWDYAAREEINTFLTVCFLTRISVATCVSVALFWPLMASWDWLSSGGIPVVPFVPLLLACAAAQAIVAFNLEVARASHKPWHFSIIQISETILQSVASAALVLFGWGAVGPLAGYLAGAILTAIVAGIWFVSRHGTLSGLHWGITWESLRYGIGTLPTSASTWLRRMADRIMVGRSISMSGLAIYQLAASGMAPLTILMGSFNSTYLPYYYEQRKRGERHLPKLVAIDMLIIAGLAGISVATVALLPELIHILAPPSYAPAMQLAPYFVLIAFYGGMTLQFTKELMFLKRPELAGLVSIVPSLLGVAANVIVIPRFGTMGATIVGTIVSISILAGSIIVTRRIENSGHNLVRLSAACAAVTLFALIFAGLHFAAFDPVSLLMRLAATLVCMGCIVLVLGMTHAWRTAAGGAL